HQDDSTRSAKARPLHVAEIEARPGRVGDMSDPICHHCGEPLRATARRHARFCSPAHRAAHHRSTAVKTPRVRFLEAIEAKKPEAATRYVAFVPDERFPGMYRLKRTDGTLSDMVNLTRAKKALAAMHGRA